MAQRDISEHVAGSTQAHVVIVYDPGSDLIVSVGAESGVDAAVEAAFRQIQKTPTAAPDTLACDPTVAPAVGLQCAAVQPPPTVVPADNAELRTVSALFEDFLAAGPPGRAHAQAVNALEEPSRRFIASQCWKRRTDSQPLLLDASINGDRAGGIVCVMGNGGESWGVSVFPDGDAFTAVMEGDGARMPPDGVLSCVLDRRALRTAMLPAVEMAASIRKGEAEPARGREVALLHVALTAAAEAPRVGQAEPASGTISTPDFDASYIVYDVEGAERMHTRSRPQRSRAAVPRRTSPAIRFDVLSRETVDELVSPEDELAWDLLCAMPKSAGLPAVYVAFDTAAEAASLVRAVETGNYLGVAAEPTPMGAMLRLIGRGEPIALGLVGTNWSPLRGFMRRRERSGGLHALVVASLESVDLVGLFVCVLPQPAEATPRTKADHRRGPRVNRTRNRP